MNHTEAIQEIIKVVPESKEEFDEVYKTKNSFMVINVFTRQIRNLIRRGETSILITSFEKMNELYQKGDQALKNAVENVFVYSLDSLTFSCNHTYKNLIFSKMPTGLYQAYLRQIYKSGL
ncbi:DUF7674 family protein [Epilithonimonas tenax]|uniref:DUF7674 family protein n=1 Tax=Epilithonimonas tenax TaxID=191577 RepID=UPI0004119BE5|nr:hypothetical protein [Epilithonimonas tenax]